MSVNHEAVRPRSDRELVTSREVDVRPDRVFEAFSDPTQLARWWGPDGFTNTFHVFDFLPGGSWKFTMHGPTGSDFPNESEFMEIDAPSRLVIRHLSKPRFTAEFEFLPRPAGTLVVFRQVFESAQDRERIAKFAVDANEQNLNRLERVLKEGAD